MRDEIMVYFFVCLIATGSKLEMLINAFAIHYLEEDKLAPLEETNLGVYLSAFSTL